MRWKFVIPLLVVTILIAVFNIMFLDSILKTGIIKGGQMAFGAKVEVGGVKTKIKDLSIEISGLAVADKSDEWKNLVEADSIRFSLNFIPMLSKKAIIEEMALEGLKMGTKRDTSGALPAQELAEIEEQQDPPGAASKFAGKINNKASNEIKELPGMDVIKKAEQEIKNISVDKLVDAAGLSSIKGMDTLKDDFKNKCSEYKGKLENLKTDEKLKGALSELNSLKSTKLAGINDIEALKKKIENIDNTKKDLESSIKEIKAVESEMKRGLKVEKELAAKIKELKKKDFQDISAKMKLPDVSFGNIAEPLFGPVWLSRVESVMRYLELARKYMPPKKDEDENEKKAAKPKTRSGGLDVSFPKKDNPPDLLIKSISLSGLTGDISISGTVNDVTSNQPQLGRPARALINGNKDQKQLEVSAILDHTSQEAVDTLNIRYDGLSLKELGLPSSDYLPLTDKGEAVINSKFILKGDKLECTLNMSLTDFEVSGSADESIKSLWKGISEVSVDAKLSGGPDNLDMSVSSNLDSIFSKRLKSLIGENLAKAKDKINSEINRLTSGKKKELLGEVKSRRQGVENQFAGKRKEAQARVDAIKSEVEKKKKEINDKMEAEKNKAIQEAEKKKKEVNDRMKREAAAAQKQIDEEKKKTEKQMKDKLKNMFQ